MSWLTPGMLAVALIAAVPLWIHLASRPPPATHTVASVMFLRAHDLSVRHHRRVRDRVLLLLRTLILLALAIALAQPHLDDTDNTLAMQDLPTVVVLDRSASMQIGSRWNAAQAEAQSAREDAGGWRTGEEIPGTRRREEGVPVPIAEDSGLLP